MPGIVTKLSVFASKQHESDQYYAGDIVGRTDALIAIAQYVSEWGLTKALNEAHAYKNEDGELIVFLVTEEVVDETQ